MEDTVDPTEYQKQVIYGAILGDGRLERPKRATLGCRFKIDASVQKD
jgi:hypothetical protein